MERNRPWIIDALKRGTHIGLLILDPEYLEQAFQTEDRDITPNLDKTTGYCKQLKEQYPKEMENFEVRGYAGHLYYTGIFSDQISTLRII